MKHLIKRLRRPASLAGTYLRNTITRFDPWFFNAVTIQTSRACNRKCPYCAVSTREPVKQEFISLEHWTLFCRRIAEIGYDGEVDVIHYNEPLLNPNLVGLLEHARLETQPFKMIVTTNGDRLTPDLATRIIDTGVIRINVTRHPPHSDEWDERIRQVRAAIGDRLNFIPTPGIGQWSNQGGLAQTPEPIPVRHTCFFAGVVILMNGDVVLCCNDVLGRHVMGNIVDTPLKEVWYSERWVALRRTLRRGKIDLEICRKCLGLE